MSIRFKQIIVVFALLYFQDLLSQQQQKDPFSQSTDSILSIIKGNKEDSNQVKALLTIAWNEYNLAFYENGNIEEAIINGRQGWILAKKIKYKHGVGRANFVLGMCSAAKGNYAESRQHHYMALKIALEERDKVQTFIEYYHIGIACNLLGTYEEALENHFAALKIIRLINAEEWLPNSYAAIGNVYLNMENFAEANKYLEDAYFFASTRKTQPLMGEILLYLGNSLLAQTKYDAALSRYSNALKFLGDQKGRRHLAQVYYGLANVFLKKAYIGKDSPIRSKYFLTAIDYLHKSLTLDRQMGYKDGCMRDYSALTEAYTGIGDYKNALTYYELFSRSTDSSDSKSPYLKISQLKIKYETEKAAIELRAQQEKEKLKEEAIQAKILADQKLEHERTIAEEKTKYEKSITEEKIEYEKIKAEQKRRNSLLLMGFGTLSITSVLVILYLRQRNLKRTAVEKAQAIHKMAELEMQSLRSQLNPHFMFNSLNSIQELILLEENEKSHSYLSRFAKLLRLLLENAEKPFIPLQKELVFLQLYLDLERLRIPDLQYSISTDPTVNTEETMIPNMILQPYIENAIWHGLSHKTDNRQLQIRIFRINGTINYEIEDNGVGRKKAAELKSLFRKQHSSKGMELLSKRFKLLNEEYSPKIKTSIADVIKNGEVVGTLVSINVPAEFSEQLKK